MRDLYERILFMLTVRNERYRKSSPCPPPLKGIRREELTTRNFQGAQQLHDPSIHDDSIPELQFFREL